MNQISAEKNMPKDMVIDAVKSAFKTAYRKQYGNKNQNLDVELNEDSQNAIIYLVKTVVEKVEDEDIEMSLKDAQKYDKKIKIGEEIKIDVTPLAGYGRIAAQAAKQVKMQRGQE